MDKQQRVAAYREIFALMAKHEIGVDELYGLTLAGDELAFTDECEEGERIATDEELASAVTDILAHSSRDIAESIAESAEAVIEELGLDGVREACAR